MIIRFQKFIFVCFLIFFIEIGFSEQISWNEIQKYLLPDSHPAKIALDKIPLIPAAFSNRQKLISYGFIDKNISGLKDQPWSIHVVSYPILEGYLIKTYDIKKGDRHFVRILPQYIQRILNAEKIREFIHTNGLKHIVVPKKWLYPLPPTFSDRHSPLKFLLIVEDMHILEGSAGNSENSYHYHHMPEEHLFELLDILFFLKTYDATLQNIPFTKKNQLAMIDTAFSGYEDLCLTHVIPYLRPELQNVARGFWDSVKLLK